MSAARRGLMASDLEHSRLTVSLRFATPKALFARRSIRRRVRDIRFESPSTSTTGFEFPARPFAARIRAAPRAVKMAFSFQLLKVLKMAATIRFCSFVPSHFCPADCSAVTLGAGRTAYQELPQRMRFACASHVRPTSTVYIRMPFMISV